MAGVVPLSVDKTKVLVIQSSRRNTWVLPKGGWETDEKTAQEAARREAWEEAGIVCTIQRDLGKIPEMRPLGQLSASAPKALYQFYEVSVEREAAQWPEQHKRGRQWMTYVQAKVALAARPELLEALNRSHISRWPWSDPALDFLKDGDNTYDCKLTARFKRCVIIYSSRLGCWVGRKAQWNRTVHISWNDGMQFRQYLCRKTFCCAKLPLLREIISAACLHWRLSQCSLDLLLGFANHKIKSVFDSNLLAIWVNCIIWWVAEAPNIEVLGDASTPSQYALITCNNRFSSLYLLNIDLPTLWKARFCVLIDLNGRKSYRWKASWTTFFFDCMRE